MSDEETTSPIAAAQAGHELDGDQLRTYSPERYVLAQAMGLSWPYIGEDGVEQVKSTGIYPGHMKDVAILLWVLRLKESAELTREEQQAREWSVSRALTNPKGAVRAAIGWASTSGYMAAQSDKFDAASKLFYEITNPVENAKFKTSASGGDDDGPKV